MLGEDAAKIRRAMNLIREDRERFTVTDEKVALWTRSLGSFPETTLLDAVRRTLESVKGFVTLAHVRGFLRTPEGTPDDRPREEVARVILADCRFSGEPLYDPHRPFSDALEAYRLWRQGNGLFEMPPGWTEPHHTEAGLIAFLDRVAGLARMEYVDFNP